MTIVLPPDLERLVKEKVGSGEYASETEFVCEALRREFEEDAVRDWLRAEARVGFAQLEAGDFHTVTRDELLERLAQRRG